MFPKIELRPAARSAQGAASMIIFREGLKLAAQAALVEHDYMVEAFAADSPDHPFDVGPLVFRQHATVDNDLFFRRVAYWDAEQEREFVFLTNHVELAPSQVAAIYKQGWQVELFFKALKKNLRVKTFVGTSANALKIQIWTAVRFAVFRATAKNDGRISSSSMIRS
jgi:hypothetical protein